MDLKQLEYFLEAAEAKNITAAAKKIHMAQPPLSRQIAMLEDELGTQLIKRNNKGIELTEAGTIICKKSKEIFDIISEIRELVQETEAGVRGRINIGSVYSTIPFYLERIKYFRAAYPQVTFNIMYGDPDELSTLLEKGLVDMIFLQSPTYETKKFQYKILQECGLALLMHRALDPAPDQQTIKTAQLRGVPVCILRGSIFSGYNELLFNACKKQGFSPNIVCECHDTPVAVAMAADRIGVTYLSRPMEYLLPRTDVYFKDIADLEVKTYPTLVWDANAYHSRGVSLFLYSFE